MAVTTQKLTQTSRVSAKVEGRPAHVNVFFLQIMGKFVTCRLAVRNFRPIMARFKMTAAIMRTLYWHWVLSKSVIAPQLYILLILMLHISPIPIRNRRLEKPICLHRYLFLRSLCCWETNEPLSNLDSLSHWLHWLERLLILLDLSTPMSTA